MFQYRLLYKQEEVTSFISFILDRHWERHRELSGMLIKNVTSKLIVGNIVVHRRDIGPVAR